MVRVNRNQPTTSGEVPRSPKASKELKASVRDVTKALDGPSEGMQGRPSRIKLMGESSSKVAYKTNATFSTSLIGPVEDIQKRALEAIESFGDDKAAWGA